MQRCGGVSVAIGENHLFFLSDCFFSNSGHNRQYFIGLIISLTLRDTCIFYQLLEQNVSLILLYLIVFVSGIKYLMFYIYLMVICFIS